MYSQNPTRRARAQWPIGAFGAQPQIALPPEVASEIQLGEQLHVVVMWEPSTLDLAWRTAGRKWFEAQYSLEDAVYEQLIDDSTIRFSPANRLKCR
jgi:hypothetical protein